MDAVMDLPLPRRLKLFLLAQNDKEGHPGNTPPMKDDSQTDGPGEEGASKT